MAVLEDFTRISAGQDIALEGHVERCPRCGRSGIEQHLDGGNPVYVHAQTSEILGDGMRVEPQDCCSLPRP